MEEEKGNILAWQGQALDATAQYVSAFRARCLLREARWATLATQQPATQQPTTQQPGADGPMPYASLVTHAVAPDGAVLMLLSSLAVHATHLVANPRCALMVTGQPENLNWQTAPRVTVQGQAEISQDTALRDHWLARHPYARLYAGFTDFAVWRMAPSAAAYVAGFARAFALAASDMAPPPAAVAALQAAQLDLIAHCNTHQAEALNKLAHAKGASGRWRMLGVDPDGFDLAQDEAVLRVAFPAPVADGPAAQSAVLHLLEAARRHF